MSRGKYSSTRKILSAESIIPFCTGRTAYAISQSLGECYEVVKRHLRLMVNRKEITEELRGRRIYYRA